MDYAPETWRVTDHDEAVLIALTCKTCGRSYLPHVDICPRCLGEQFEPQENADGQLHSYTAVHVMPDGFPHPTVVGYVDLPSGARCFGHFDPAVSHTQLRLNTRVSFRVGELFRTSNGEAVRGYMFVPRPDIPEEAQNA